MFKELTDQCRSFSDEVHKLSLCGWEEKMAGAGYSHVRWNKLKLKWSDVGQIWTAWYQDKKLKE